MTKSIKRLLSIAAAAVVGLSTLSITACAHTHSEEVPVRENVVESTCTQEGSYDEVIYCSSCKEELKRVNKTLERAPHTPGERQVEDEIAPSCTVSGSYDEVYYCTVCKEEISRETKTVLKTEHKAGEAVIENKVEATCTAKGSYDEVTYCTECDSEISRTTNVIDLAEHRYLMVNDAKYHWYKCEDCNATTDKTEHIPGDAPTETTAQRCTVCNYVLAEPVGHIHNLTFTAATAATCLEHGNIAYYTCSGCGKNFEDENGEKEIVNLNATIIPATGHAFSGDWNSDDKYHWHDAICEHSEETSAKGAHTYDDGVINGTEIIYTCTVCGNTTSKHVVVFDMNMQDKENLVVYVNDGERVEKPATPTYTGFTFMNWYSDAECNKKFDFNTTITQGITLYASWNGTYVFEAEDTYLDDQEGKGYSNDAYGTDMIQADSNGAANASGGYFVGYMYNPGVTITFEIESNKDDFNANLTVRLSGELVSEITLSDEKYRIEVNGNKVSYSDITISDIDTDISKTDKREFQDFNLGRIILQKGKNVITLTVNNSDGMKGTMKATAPLLDCIKIRTSAALTFEFYDNPKPQ